MNWCCLLLLIHSRLCIYSKASHQQTLHDTWVIFFHIYRTRACIVLSPYVFVVQIDREYDLVMVYWQQHSNLGSFFACED